MSAKVVLFKKNQYAVVPIFLQKVTGIFHYGKQTCFTQGKRYD
jgi:hypothetical protein